MSLICEVQDRIMVIRIDRPEKLNAIDPETRAKLRPAQGLWKLSPPLWPLRP
jgi:enoyl-CoA hydratase/carnithine racemase